MGSKGNYIGSTECASILGCGFNTPMEVFMQLTGLAPEFKPTEAMEAGLFLEPGIRRMMEVKLDSEIFTGDKIQHWRHPEYPMIGGTDDGAIFKRPALKTDEIDTGVEIKLVGPHMAREFGDEGDAIPAKYLLQTQHNMLTGRRKRFVVGAFFMAEMRLRIYRVDRDAELCAMLLEREVSFWKNHVEKKIPPAEDDPAIVREYLKQRYPTHADDMLTANMELLALAHKLAGVKIIQKSADRQREELENKFKAIIGDCQGVTFGENDRITWNKAKNSIRTDAHAAYCELTTHVPEKLAQTIWEKHTKIVPGSRRFLVHGKMFDAEQENG